MTARRKQGGTPTTGAAIIELWDLHVETSGSQRLADDGILDPAERVRAERFRFEKDRALFVTCRAALRRILARRLHVRPADVPLRTDPLGKPVVANADFHFNVSHAGERGLIVVCPRPVGVDIESLRPVEDAEAISRRFFTSAEQAAVLRNRDERVIARRFLMCWTLKEALLKARGVGLSGSLTDFSVDIDSDPPQLTWGRVSPPNAATWSLGFLPTVENYVGAVAVDSPSWELCPRTDTD